MDNSVKKLINDYLYEHKILVRTLAGHLGLTKRNLYYLLNKDDMPVSLLITISKVLNHNFFADFNPLDDKKPASTLTSSPTIDVAALQHLNTLLTQENSYLKQVNQLLTEVNESLRKQQSSI